MCKVCKRRGNILLHPYEKEREKKGVEEDQTTANRILPEDLRRRPGFLYRLKEKWYDNIVLNIPHASINGIGLTQWENQDTLLPVIRKWTDWYTDLIFIPEKKDRIKTIVADYSRFVVDVERLPDDPLNECGQGIIYTDFNGFHRDVDEEEKMVLMGYYYSYINKLKSMLSDHSLLIDCHSFPSDLNDVDICIGYNDDWSRPTDFIIGLVAEVFKRHGLKVEFNTPYSNTIAPKTSYTYNSIMIEINKRVYLNERTLELNNFAPKLKEQLAILYSLLLRYSEEV
jgi:N-formylglutamate amidohydrolase